MLFSPRRIVIPGLAGSINYLLGGLLLWAESHVFRERELSYQFGQEGRAGSGVSLSPWPPRGLRAPQPGPALSLAVTPTGGDAGPLPYP